MLDQNVQQEQQPQDPQTPAALTIVDLQNIRSIIELSSRRGAFMAGELVSVGLIYNKLDAFLKIVLASQQPVATEEQPTQ